MNLRSFLSIKSYLSRNQKNQTVFVNLISKASDSQILAEFSRKAPSGARKTLQSQTKINFIILYRGAKINDDS